VAAVARVLTYAGLTLAGAVLGLVGGFLHAFPAPLLGVDVPVLLPAALAVLVVLVVGGSALTGSRLGAALPALAWLLVTVPLAIQRPEGDLVVAGTLAGLVYLLGGVVVAGTGVGLPPDVVRGLRPSARAREEPVNRSAPAGYPPVGS
jgi:hypothetical protein